MRAAPMLLLLLALAGCKEPEPRKAEEVKSGSFYRESIERNKRILAEEVKSIEEIIERDSVHNYIQSPNGFWYFYESQNESSPYLPREGDQILFTYTLMSLQGDTIYTAEELGPTS